MRSGMSGERYLPHHLNDSSGKHPFRENMFGVGQRLRHLFIGRRRQTVFFDQITTSARLMVEMAIFRVAAAASLISVPAAADSLASSNKTAKRRVGIGNGCNRHWSSPKLRNISARLASISPAEGASPHLVNMPRYTEEVCPTRYFRDWKP